jgi:hypothetical protein
MNDQQWREVPVGPSAQRWVTRKDCRTVLVATHTVVAGQRLLDVVGLIEDDPRIQVVYTRMPDVFGRGVAEFLTSIDALEIPWEQARHERFDLALAAAYGCVDQIHAPLMELPHGASFGKRGQGTGPVYGLDAGRLLHDGQVVPASLVLSHESQLEVLRRQCPTAVDVAVVAGDPCLDRMVASVPLRGEYRRALGVGPDRELVVIASTWGRHSLFERFEKYLPTLLARLDPERYEVAMLVHPAVWFGHGRRQVRAWLSAARNAGMLLIEPDVDWRAAVLAADFVLGDHGSTTTYAAALGRPVLCTDLPVEELNPDSPQAFLGMHAPRFARSRPLPDQFRDAVAWQKSLPPGDIAARLTSRPGQAHRLLRWEMYRLLGLSVPGRHRAPEPIPVPPGLSGGARW